MRINFTTLVHYADSPLHPGKALNDLPQKCCLAAVRFTDYKHPDKMPSQDLAKPVRQHQRNCTRDPQIQRLHLLQDHLPVAVHIAAGNSDPAAGRCGKEPLRQFVLMCMDRTAAQSVKDLFELQLIQYAFPQ